MGLYRRCDLCSISNEDKPFNVTQIYFSRILGYPTEINQVSWASRDMCQDCKRKLEDLYNKFLKENIYDLESIKDV
jgi:hypothetical protein